MSFSAERRCAQCLPATDIHSIHVTGHVLMPVANDSWREPQKSDPRSGHKSQLEPVPLAICTSQRCYCGKCVFYEACGESAHSASSAHDPDPAAAGPLSAPRETPPRLNDLPGYSASRRTPLAARTATVRVCCSIARVRVCLGQVGLPDRSLARIGDAWSGDFFFFIRFHDYYWDPEQEPPTVARSDAQRFSRSKRTSAKASYARCGRRKCHATTCLPRLAELSAAAACARFCLRWWWDTSSAQLSAALNQRQ